MLRIISSGILSIGLAMLMASHALGAVATYQQGVGGYLGAGDTYIAGDNRGSAPTDPQASASRLGIYEREVSLNNSSRALIRFDNILNDPEAVVTGASFTVTVNDSQDTNVTPSGTWSLYALSAANKDWSPATATWNNKNQSGPTPWAGSAGVSSAGTDYLATAIASWAFDNSTMNAGTVATFTFTPAGVALLQDWIDNPSNNAGFLLRLDGAQGQDRNDGVHSSEAALLSDRPLLTINYVVPEPGTAGVLMGMVMLAFARRRR
jgi:hypothetical protein